MIEPAVSASARTTLLDAVFNRAPQSPALRVGGVTVTIAELEETSATIAAWLVARGLGPESLVALGLPRGTWLVAWVLGCWRAGVAFVTLDPAYPAARLAHMVEDARASLVIVDGPAPAWAPHAISPRLEGKARAPHVAASDDALAYVIYTSGSTGRPKGVEVSFRGLVNLARAQIALFAIDPTSRVLQFASPSFDAFVAELLSALVAGATLVLGAADELVPGTELVELCRREAVTVATFPPSLLAVLEPKKFSTLRTVVSAGERCTVETVRAWAPGRVFVNAYGPTEATVCATETRVTELDVAHVAPGLGDALPGVELHVLDEHGLPAVSGELYLGGVSLARGYRGLPELTAEKFRPHPTARGARLYRTGDRVRRDETGALHFTGRIDDQVKVRGFRVELGDIEAALRGAPGVLDAVAAVATSTRALPILSAWIIARPGVSVDEVRKHVRTMLPSHAVPDSLALVDALPRTPNGKVDRRALPAPRRARPADLPPPSAPRDDDERALVALFAEVLDVADYGAEDDFFALGGHSLAAAVLLSRLDGGRRPLSLLLEAPTPRRLSARLRDAVSTSSLPPGLVLLREGPAEAPPLLLFHPVTGNASCYLPLAAALGGDRAVYGMEVTRADERSATRSFAAMCAAYADVVRSFFGQGPFFLGGWSVGGTTAVEVARQARASGADVPLVVLLDAWSPTLYPRPADRPSDAMIDFLFIKNSLGRATGFDIPVTPPQLMALDEAQRLELVRSWAYKRGVFPESTPDALVRNAIDVFGEVLRGYLAFDAERYEGPVLHIQATESLPGHPRPPSLGWDALLPRCDNVHIADSTHFVFVSLPLLPRIAPLIRDTLTRMSR